MEDKRSCTFSIIFQTLQNLFKNNVITNEDKTEVKKEIIKKSQSKEFIDNFDTNRYQIEEKILYIINSKKNTLKRQTQRRIIQQMSLKNKSPVTIIEFREELETSDNEDC